VASRQRGCAAELPLPSSVRIAFISMFFNQTLPATVSGDILRIYLASREGLQIQRAVVGVMIDRIMGSIALVGLVVATLPEHFRRRPVENLYPRRPAELSGEWCW
jgi:hypothetical protein